MDLTTLTDNAECYTSVPSGNPVIDDVVDRLRTSRNDNVMSLVICTLVAIIALWIIWYVVNSIITALKNWSSHFADTSNDLNYNPDDVNYVEDSNDESDLPPVPTNTAVAAKMAKLAIEYAGYNDAMTRYSTKRNQGPPDALINQHILSRGDDNFKYPRQCRDGRVRFRKDFVEYDTIYKGGYVGLYKPSY